MNRTWLTKPGWLIVAALVLVSVAAVGCGSSSNNSSSAGGSGSTQTGPVTLKFMSLANSPSVEAAWAQLIKAFEKQNPNIKVVRTPVAYGAGGSSYRVKAKLAASSSDAPDMIEGDMGPGGVIASLVAANLMKGLDSYSTQYNWPSKFGQFIDQLKISSDGKRVGTGPVYGIPGFAEILGVFYNKSLLAKTGMGVPTTLDQFQQTLAAAKAKGITPFMVGGLDQFPWSHLYDVVSDRYGDPQQLIQWFRGDPSATVDTPQMQQAAERIQQWYSHGYFENGVNGVSDADADKRFAAGGSLYKLSGPWSTGTMLAGLGSNVGWFLMPPQTAGATETSTGWMGWSVGVTSKSKYPDQAAAFLNFLTGTTARAIMLAHDNPPGTPGTVYGPSTNPLVRTIGEDYDQVTKLGTLVPYMDVAYPQVDPYNVLANAQSMAAGKMSAQDFVKSTQAGWSQYHGY